ncbi:11359_t:CDS:2, partial [Acaulospora colombiana]
DHDSEDLLAANVADLTMDTTASEAPSDELMASASTSDIVFTPSKSGARTPRSSLRFKAQDQARVANKKKKEKDVDKSKDDTLNLSKQEEDEMRQLEDEAARIEQGLETLELEFRQYLLLPRMRPLGKDRFHCKVWWFDGVGCMTLRGNDGEYQYGTGKIFIQGPSQDDLALINAKTEVDASVGLRRGTEEGTGLLAPGEWCWYETPEEVEAYLQWLNPKGIRENALDKAFTQWRPFILGGMQARLKQSRSSAITMQLTGAPTGTATMTEPVNQTPVIHIQAGTPLAKDVLQNPLAIQTNPEAATSATSLTPSTRIATAINTLQELVQSPTTALGNPETGNVIIKNEQTGEVQELSVDELRRSYEDEEQVHEVQMPQELPPTIPGKDDVVPSGITIPAKEEPEVASEDDDEEWRLDQDTTTSIPAIISQTVSSPVAAVSNAATVVTDTTIQTAQTIKDHSNMTYTLLNEGHWYGRSPAEYVAMEWIVPYLPRPHRKTYTFTFGGFQGTIT